jgi:excisionase family DNA binding protein
MGWFQLERKITKIPKKRRYLHMHQNNQKLLPVDEAARALSISIHTLRAWVSQKRIPYVKLGRRVLFRSEDLQAYIDFHLVPARGFKGHNLSMN